MMIPDEIWVWNILPHLSVLDLLSLEQADSRIAKLLTNDDVFKVLSSINYPGIPNPRLTWREFYMNLVFRDYDDIIGYMGWGCIGWSDSNVVVQGVRLELQRRVDMNQCITLKTYVHHRYGYDQYEDIFILSSPEEAILRIDEHVGGVIEDVLGYHDFDHLRFNRERFRYAIDCYFLDEIIDEIMKGLFDSSLYSMYIKEVKINFHSRGNLTSIPASFLSEDEKS